MPKVAQLLNNLRNFRYSAQVPLRSIWPVGRRSVVLVLLFVGNSGELRVLLTKRSRKLKSFSGHVSLPGGKADFDDETFESIARREAEEEIGLPKDSDNLRKKHGMEIENITTEWPCYLSSTFLSVKPLICFLYNSSTIGTNCDNTDKYNKPLNASNFFGKLNPGETSSIFSIPLTDVIYHEQNGVKTSETTMPEHLYCKHVVQSWGGIDWPISHFYHPVDNPKEVPWLSKIEDASSGEEMYNSQKCYDIWGLTARILIDIATVAANNNHDKVTVGDTSILYALYELGNQLRPGPRSEWESGMIRGLKRYKYSDVIPEYHLAPIRRYYNANNSKKREDETNASNKEYDSLI